MQKIWWDNSWVITPGIAKIDLNIALIALNYFVNIRFEDFIEIQVQFLFFTLMYGLSNFGSLSWFWSWSAKWEGKLWAKEYVILKQLIIA